VNVCVELQDDFSCFFVCLLDFNTILGLSLLFSDLLPSQKPMVGKKNRELKDLAAEFRVIEVHVHH
jgi:hypothetical protein